MKISVDGSKTIRRINNFWNHIHFHPTDAIEDNWGRHILERVSQDKVARYVRVYAMLEDIVSKDAKGNLTFDYTLLDARLDFMVKKEFNLLICYNFMPPCIAEDPNNMSKMPRYKGKRINFSKPADFKEWQEVCRCFTEHIVERYGIEMVENWYMHCWNEPDHCYWLSGTTADECDEEKLTSYCNLYDYFAEGVSEVSKNIKIGGPSAAYNKRFIEEFIIHTQRGTNYATGKKGSKFDFLSIHTYSNSTKNVNMGQNPNVKNILSKILFANGLLEQHGLRGTEIIVDEWGITSGGFANISQYPELEFRDRSYSAAFFAKLICKCIDGFHKNNINLNKMMICLSGQHNLKKEFEGYRNFFTLNQFPKPIYNAFCLTAKLGDNLLSCNIETGDDTIGAVATRDDYGNYKILIYYMDENTRVKLQNKRINLKISQINGSYILKHYRIDHGNSNAYTKWCELGSPENPDQLQREEIMESSRLSLLFPEETVNITEEYSKKIIMTDCSVSLLELSRV